MRKKLKTRKRIRWLRMFTILFLALVLGVVSTITGIDAFHIWIVGVAVFIGPMIIYAIYLYIRMQISIIKSREAESRAMAAQHEFRMSLRDNGLRKEEEKLVEIISNAKNKNAPSVNCEK
jgi:hypothetical protein